MTIPAIGVIVPRMNDHFITSALQGIGQAMDLRGYEVMITHSDESYALEVAAARLLIRQDIRGVIACLSAETRDMSHFRSFTRQGVPVVFFDHVRDLEKTTSVVIDHRHCGYIAAEHLIRQGCRRIAIVTSNLQQGDNAQRYEGFLRSLRNYDVPFSDELLIVGDMDEDSGADAATQLLCMDPMPDGVFITSDLVAAICMHVLEKAGVRVPADMAIVGFNNEPAARLITPSLTTIDYPGREVGKVAAERLLERISGGMTDVEPHTVVVPAELIVRHSSLRTNSFRSFTLTCS